MIPTNIKKEHILKAMEYIDNHSIPKKRKSTQYDILYKGKTYPPKYTISIANRICNGQELASVDFYGGNESNRMLESLGFIIIYKEEL